MRRLMCTAGILAGALTCCLASPARADFSLQVRENGVSGNTGFKIDETSSGKWTLTTYGSLKASDVTWSADSGTIHASATVDGYKLDLYGKSNMQNAASVGIVSFNGQVTATAGAKATSFSYFVADDPFKFPGTSNGKIYLTSSVFTLKDFTSGNSVQSQGQYTAYGSNTTVKSYLTNIAGPLKAASQSASAPTLAINPRGDRYSIADLGSVALNGKAGSVHFWSQAVTALPEPTGVMIALLGVPCLALILVFARRRGAGYSPVA